ncbi:MAG: IS1595 family transposase [Reyranellales bacterium]
MSRSIFSAPHFNDEAAAYAYVEARLWADGRSCPKCGVLDRSAPLKGKTNRIGLYKCYACRSPFTVKVGTIFEDSHIQMRDWLAAIHMICSSKKGVSSNQLHSTLGITLKSAWFMSHRIREALKETNPEPMGGAGQHVEADETFIGRKHGVKVQASVHHKHAVFSLVERGGRARSFHIDKLSAATIARITKENVSRESTLNTDEALRYRKMGKEFAQHLSVNHGAGVYVDGAATTNTVESFFSVFKRGMRGTYQHCGEKHLQRYLTEFDFRYSNRAALGIDDTERATAALKGAAGKRLTYRRINERPEADPLG